MIEKITTTVMILGSGTLLAYWFRYSCALILSARTTRDFIPEMVTTNQLGFVTTQARLRDAAPADFAGLQAMLDRDYILLNKMMGTKAGMEEKLLRVNYRMLNAWYCTIKPFSADAAKQALTEMSSVVAHFANMVGESAACAA